MAFDDVDFDEPMEVGMEEEKLTVKDTVPKVEATEVAPEVEIKAEPQLPVLS